MKMVLCDVCRQEKNNISEIVLERLEYMVCWDLCGECFADFRLVVDHFIYQKSAGHQAHEKYKKRFEPFISEIEENVQ